MHVLRCLKLTESGYAFEIEVLVRAAWAGFHVHELAIHVNKTVIHGRRSQTQRGQKSKTESIVSMITRLGINSPMALCLASVSIFGIRRLI